MVNNLKNCRMCKGQDLKLFLDLGFHPPSDAFLTRGDLEKPETYYPLTVYLCMNCGMVQLGYVVPAEILYDKNYPYESSITQSGRDHFNEMSIDICRKINLDVGSLVVDIGSNVGVLLGGFKNQGMDVLGVDPAETIAKIANDNGIETWPFLFNYSTAQKIVSEKGKASVITGTNVFAHIGDLYEFMKSVDLLLSENGIFVIEVPYLVDLIEKLEYDTIYHEHLGYISVRPLVEFFKKFGMEIFDIKKVDIHGGSIRVFVARQGKQTVSDQVDNYLKNEEEKQIHSLERLYKFAQEVKEHKLKLYKLLFELKQKGKTIAGISAPAKGNTLLNYCNIDTYILEYLTEKSKIKQGLYSPGTHIPIVEDDKLFQDKPDYALILAWNFADEIMKNLKKYRGVGGKFIIPIPEPRIVE